MKFPKIDVTSMIIGMAIISGVYYFKNRNKGVTN
jgi:hypothetical protein